MAVAPDVVVHELTDLPPALDPRKMEKQAAGNDRIRVEGTRNLVAAAKNAGTMDGRTWEASINVPVITRRSLVWTSRLNGSASTDEEPAADTPAAVKA